MKHFVTMLLAVLLGVGVAIVPAAQAQGKTHQMKAEFVSADANANTVTIKDADGRTVILKAEAKALEAAKGLKAGEWVTITCRDDDQGVHQAVVSIEKSAKGEKKG